MAWTACRAKARRSLKGLKFVPYYGCTLSRPPRLAKEKYFQGEMENILTALGAEPVTTALSLPLLWLLSVGH